MPGFIQARCVFQHPLHIVTMKPVEKRRMCPQCQALITTDDKFCPYCNNELAPKPYRPKPPSDALGGLIPHARFTTIMILLVNTGFYIATVLHFGGPDLDNNTLVLFGAKYVPRIVYNHEWWRLITAGFLHGGILHILMNMWVLFDLGAQVEEMYGTSRFLVVYFVSNIAGFVASMYLMPPTVPSVGASAAIFGLIGAMVAVGVRDRSSYGSAIRSFYVRWAIYGLVLSLIPGTDWAAHIGGLVGGFLIGLVTGTPGLSATTERIWQIAAAITLAITGLAFFDMFTGLLAGK
jgi:rhomboid protease GluP